MEGEKGRGDRGVGVGGCCRPIQLLVSSMSLPPSLPPSLTTLTPLHSSLTSPLSFLPASSLSVLLSLSPFISHFSCSEPLIFTLLLLRVCVSLISSSHSFLLKLMRRTNAKSICLLLHGVESEIYSFTVCKYIPVQ